MPWWLWLVIILTGIFLIADWFIIMGTDPRQWKGGNKHDRSK